MIDNEDDVFEQYLRDELSVNEECNFAERLYNNYIAMQKSLKGLEKKKYGKEGKNLNSQDFKQGFIAGVKILSSLFLDM